MPYAIGIGVVGVVGIALLARYVLRGADGRNGRWIALLALASMIAAFTAQVASIYYRMPVGCIVALALLAGIVAVLFIRVGKAVKWASGRVVALVAIVLLSLVLLTIVMMAVPLGTLFPPLFETRAQQMADAAGFKLLLPPGEAMVTDYLPVDSLGKPIEGVTITYKRFRLDERAAGSGEGMAELQKVLAAGEDPMGMHAKIPERATYHGLSVSGEPAVGVEYSMDEWKGATRPTIHILAFVKNGVEVRMFSDSHMEYLGPPERYEQVQALSFREMLKIAESMRPLE